MKLHHPILIIAAALICTSSCKKDVSDPSVLTPQMMVGKWEIRKQLGGFIQFQDYPPGNGQIMEFTTTKIKKYLQGTLVQELNYVLHLESTSTTDCPGQLPNPEMERLLLDPDSSTARQFLSIEKGRLVVRLTCGFADMPYYFEWEKIP